MTKKLPEKRICSRCGHTFVAHCHMELPCVGFLEVVELDPIPDKVLDLEADVRGLRVWCGKLVARIEKLEARRVYYG